MSEQYYENQALNSNFYNFDGVTPPQELKPRSYSPQKGGKEPVGPFAPVAPSRVTLAGELEVTCFAPKVQEAHVQVPEAGGGTYSMEKGEDGYWRVRIGGLPRGYRTCDIYLDGVRVIHPGLPIACQPTEIHNYVDVVDLRDDYYMLRDVSHGGITMELFPSASTGRTRSCFVYTPPSYQRDLDRRYPVLYLQHGGGESAPGWVSQGRANLILDNLIARGEAEEMLVVMGHGFAYREAEGGAFEAVDVSELIARDLLPFIDGKYRTIPDRGARAAAGLSMGGGQSRHLAHRHPDLFANLGVFSSGAGFLVAGTAQGVTFDYSGLFETPERYNSLFDVTLVTCGTEDMRVEYTTPQVQELIKKGYNIRYRTYPGGHEFQVFRDSLREFLRLIFKK